MKIMNLKNNVILADKVFLAQSFRHRLIGLLNRYSLNDGEALILKPANCVHMFFMRFSIGILFLDKNGKVVSAISHFKPWMVSRMDINSVLVIELPEGVIERTSTKIGDSIKISE